MRDPSSFSEKVASACLDIPPERVDTILEIIKSSSNLVGTEFVWIWNNDGSDTCYHYRVVGNASALQAHSSQVAGIVNLKKENGDLKARLDNFEIEVHEIKKNLNALGQSVGVNASTIETKVRGRYSENCARCQVPQNHISSVIRKIFELLLNKSISPLPSYGTVNNMVSEMWFLSKVHAIDFILESSFVKNCLGCYYNQN
ncbi:hypothetical protein EB796_007197 [Bugula neritina]|uniref:Uncharacterized protein n=1 Tax=Bugula neritina TaxID=10212 RepID=A0A7J7KAB4_BUGNE|nr:hypothetical protein EB796_007197 [Bugula neritina]